MSRKQTLIPQNYTQYKRKSYSNEMAFCANIFNKFLKGAWLRETQQHFSIA